jgi:dynein light intermediate chain 2
MSPVTPAAGTEDGSVVKRSATSKETFLLFVGSKGCGKSTLINKFLNPNKKDKPKPTVAMEYTFGRRSTGASAKDIAHIWELGGGKKLSDLVAVPIDPQRLSSLVGIIVLDLSVPSKVLQTALWWVDLIRSRVRDCLEKLRSTRPGQRTADQILQNSRERLPSTHRDAKDLDICPIPLVLIANKYDLFANEDPAKRRVLMSALRFVAHTSGASLYCASSKDKKLSAHYRSMMNSS